MAFQEIDYWCQYLKVLPPKLLRDKTSMFACVVTYCHKWTQKLMFFWGRIFKWNTDMSRVNTQKQHLEVQLQQLQAESWEVIYKENFTGTNIEREELKKVLSLLKDGDT